ncbi:MAG TPA: chemotaxis response regulator protein-glutamate methylesterase [Fimbriimonadaceae bacterium]|nr:chemotaxis response regulator protein-glutamate methylesterase [Fimbriimonadaceae bacterium]
MKRVLVVDDSPFIRRMISDWVVSNPDFEVVGACADGVEAVAAAKDLKPDVVTLDIEMPKMDGIEALRQIMAEAPTNVLMVSSTTTEGAAMTLKALEMGAVDFIAKPQSGPSLSFVEAKDELIAKVVAVAEAKRHTPAAPQKCALGAKTSDRVVLVACSTGGPSALAQVWQSLPKGFPSPILVVQHMPAGFTKGLAKRLDSFGTVPCEEASDAVCPEPGRALLAPGGRHMTVTPEGAIALDDRPLFNGVRPSADYLFESAARVFGGRIVAAVLTGMGKDGADGALKVKQTGGTVLAESEETATIYGMPRAAKESGAVDQEVRIEAMAAAITDRVGEGEERAA